MKKDLSQDQNKLFQCIAAVAKNIRDDDLDQAITVHLVEQVKSGDIKDMIPSVTILAAELTTFIGNLKLIMICTWYFMHVDFEEWVRYHFGNLPTFWEMLESVVKPELNFIYNWLWRQHTFGSYG